MLSAKALEIDCWWCQNAQPTLNMYCVQHILEFEMSHCVYCDEGWEDTRVYANDMISAGGRRYLMKISRESLY